MFLRREGKVKRCQESTDTLKNKYSNRVFVRSVDPSGWFHFPRFPCISCLLYLCENTIENVCSMVKLLSNSSTSREASNIHCPELLVMKQEKLLGVLNYVISSLNSSIVSVSMVLRVLDVVSGLFVGCERDHIVCVNC